MRKGVKEYSNKNKNKNNNVNQVQIYKLISLLYSKINDFSLTSLKLYLEQRVF
jgi:hypothetical protein